MKGSMRCFLVLAALLAGLNTLLTAQVAPGRYWVGFEDKVGCGYDVSEPTDFLSARALARRDVAGIDVDSLDLPVAGQRIDEVLSVDPSISLVHESRWFNGAVFHLTDSASTDSILGVLGSLSGVVEVRREAVISGERLPAEGRVFNGVKSESVKSSGSAPNYGASQGQIEMLNLHLLHGLGHLGEGLRIAVLDAGFDNTDELAPFDVGFAAGRIQEGLDVVAGVGSASEPWQYAYHGHGTMVLSLMAANSPGEIVGSGPASEYRLYRTEDAGSERLIEEFNWTVAAEHADSIGCDIINSSLGYALFDDSLDHHAYEFMNGQTYRISLAAGVAATRGMLVLTSAGNSGDNPWHYITAPADAFGILSVGAVDGMRNHANFSGYGPSADGRVKPEVCAQGRDATYLHPDGIVRQGNGTSFSSPLLAGAAATLWSAHPLRTAAEIRGAIIESADRYDNPDDAYGYGIPNFWRAHQLLGGNILDDVMSSGGELLVFPNPSSYSDGLLRVVYNTAGSLSSSSDLSWRLIDASGRLVKDGQVARSKSSLVTFHIDVQALAAGSYILEAYGEDGGENRAWQRVLIAP